MIRLVAFDREGARALYFEDDDKTLRGDSQEGHPPVVVPDLDVGTHEYPEVDPAAALPAPSAPAGAVDPVDGEVIAPGGRLSVAPVKIGRRLGVAFLRLPERTLVRFIGGASCAAWTEDGQMLAFGGDWGVIVAVPATTRE